MVRVGFIGAGNMAYALIKGILTKGITDPKGIIASDINKNRLYKISNELDIKVTEDNCDVINKSDIIFLAVKPQNMQTVLNEIKDSISKDKIIVSIAAGIKLHQIEKILGNKKIVRVMPNTPCLVGEMAAGFTPNKNLDEAEIDTVEIILNSSGTALRLNELLLDAVTGLSGSGPAFVARIIDEFIEAGKDNGLREDIARKLTLKTFIGTAKLLDEKNLDPKELIDMVSSPEGTTIEGRKILDNSDIKQIINNTVSNAVRKSHELGENGHNE